MRITTPLLLIAILMLSGGCVSTQVRSHTDTNYSNHIISSVAVLAISEDIGLSEALEKSIMEGLVEHGARVVRSTDLLPPTREYEIDKIKTTLLSKGITNLLMVEVIGSNQTSQVVGYQSYGQAYGTAYGSAYSIGNTTYANVSGSSSSNTTSYAVNRYKRNTVTTSRLYDVSTSDTIWTAQTETEAGGLLFVSDSSTGGSLAASIIDELVSKGHLVKK